MVRHDRDLDARGTDGAMEPAQIVEQPDLVGDRLDERIDLAALGQEVVVGIDDEERCLLSGVSILDHRPFSLARHVAGCTGFDDRTVLMLRELFMGSHRFEQLQAQTGATPLMIAACLKTLETDGLVKRRAYSKRPLRHEYHLTEKGEAFFPVLHALRAVGKNMVQVSEGRSRCQLRAIGPAGSRWDLVLFVNLAARFCVARI